MNYKIPIIGVLLILLSFGVQAQQVTRSLIASDGGSATSADIQLDWTFGESVTETVHTADGSFTQGFQQPQLNVKRQTAIRTEGTFDVTVYPNPASYVLNIKPTVSSNTRYTAEIVDVSGKVISSNSLNAIEGVSQVDIEALSAGSYFIVVRQEGVTTPISYQFVKI